MKTKKKVNGASLKRVVSCQFDDKMTVGRGFGRLTDNGTKSGETYTEGYVATPHGIVTAYSQGDADSFHHTRLDVVKDGILYMKNIKRRYSKRGLVTLAKRFAATVAANDKLSDASDAFAPASG